MQEQFYGIQNDYREQVGDVVRRDTQYFPDSYWDGLQWARSEQTKASRCKNFHKVADVPAIFYTKYLAQGFDLYRESAKDIVARLKADGLHDFVTTEKSV